MSISPARVILFAGGVITAVASIALLTILVFYFADLTPHSWVYFAALWGFPAGFSLMILHMLLSIRGRRRRRVSA